MNDTLERDGGFCSGGDDDDIEAEDGIHSPTDASEDSVDVKVQAISLRNKNKRKSAEPRRVDTDLPAKKRKIDLTGEKSEKESADTRNCSPFRPWSASPPSQSSIRDEALRYPQTRIGLKSELESRSDLRVILLPRLSSPQLPLAASNPSPVYAIPLSVHSRDSGGGLRAVPPGAGVVGQYAEAQDEPLSLVSKKREDCDGKRGNHGKARNAMPLNQTSRMGKNLGEPTPKMWHHSASDSQLTSGNSGDREKDKFPAGCRARNCKTMSDKKLKMDAKGKSDDGSHHSDNKFRIDTLLSSSKTDNRLSAAAGPKPSQGGQQRNYKNMTRERRIEANARERTRVHTISAAFDTLRHSIPAYSHNQKLSKLSVLRIACSYIMTLSRLAGYDYSKDQSEPEIAHCVENVSKTIQTEGKIRKKKDD